MKRPEVKIPDNEQNITDMNVWIR